MSARNPGLAVPSGILNVAKPPGCTSHDVVDAVRRATGLRRVGHAGTLDPAATGVLLVCLGSATRVSDYLMASTKAYRATIRFGEVSATDDAEGELTVSGSVDSLDESTIRQAVSQFVGEIDQVPPSYAAIKIAGQPLYRRARAGQPVLAPPRRVQIERIELVAWERPTLVVDVTCSKGTYLRALARDLGQALGCGAYLRSLVRTRSGRFSLDNASSLDEITLAAGSGYLDRLMYPLDAAFADWPAVVVEPEVVAQLRNGRYWTGDVSLAVNGLRAYAADTGRLVAILRADAGDARWRPAIVFREDDTDDAA
jgi:tRNA pseudouridine55 synthase